MQKSYGGMIWSNEEPNRNNPGSTRMVGNIALAGLAGTVFYRNLRTLPSGYQGTDYLAASARLGGNLFPFQLANTFRIPEFLSPFLSDKYRGFNKMSWGHEALKNDSTYEWLKYSTGLDDIALREKGIIRGMMQGGDVAHTIEWRSTSKGNGILEAVMPSGERRTISQNISLMASNEEILNPLTGRTGVGRVPISIYSAADMYRNKNFRDIDVFSFVDSNGERQASKFIPMPSMSGSDNSAAGLFRRSTWLRSMPAFEMSRFNLLLENVVEQFGGETGKKFFKNVLGISPTVMQGPASHMFGRYGMAVAGAGVIAGGISSLDWMRRQNIGGQYAASTATSAALMFAGKKMGMTNKNTMILGAASFATQMLAPGFDKGILEGISTTAVGLDILRGAPVNPFHYYRRTVEGYAPGISDTQTGLAFAAGTVIASHLALPGMKERLNVKLARATDVFGGKYNADIVLQNMSLRDLFYRRVGQELLMADEDTFGFFNRKTMIKDFLELDNDRLKGINTLNQFWSFAEEQYNTIKENNPLNKELVDRLRTISNTETGFTKYIKGFFEEAKMSFWGADITKNKALMQEVKDMGFKYLPVGGKWGRATMVGSAAFLAHSFFTGNMFGSMESSQELMDIYSGKQLVEIKKSRWWEGGSNSFEGSETSYYRPHAYALMMNRVREKGIWGADEDEQSPVMKWLTKNFTYELEKENYYSRPYPITSGAFSDIPIIGGMLSATIGQIIKPPKYMHVNAWTRTGPEGNTEYGDVFKGSMIEPAYSLGAVGTGIPVNPYSSRILASNMASHFKEIEGMTGWAKSTVSDIIFGTDTWSSDEARLMNSGEMTSWGNRFWEAETGGAFFSNEFLRRIFAKQDSSIKKFNPIYNDMPSWMPDKYKYGDPYRAVQWGEARLPGSGFAALHPELEGVNPEAYPDIYKYQILSDIAPMSAEFYKTQQRLYQARQNGQLTEPVIQYMDQIEKNRQKVVNKFNEYDESKAIKMPGSGITSAIWKKSNEWVRALAAPFEYLMPMGFRPTQKLLSSTRDAVSDYEETRLYGTSLAFWDKPVRDWFRPAGYSFLHLLGYQGKPLWKAEADKMNEYFDQLKFIKYMTLAKNARAEGSGMASTYEFQAAQTRVGVNPQGNPLSIYWSLPGDDRKYFNSFTLAKSNFDRKRILEMVPKDQKHLYQAIWTRMDRGEPIYQGNENSTDSQYLQEKYTQIMESDIKLPGADWIGWHQDVDISDIQVRYINQMGKDLHDYGMWESELRKSESQPFLNGSTRPFQEMGLYGTNIRSEIYNMLSRAGGNNSQLNYSSVPGPNPYALLEYKDTREQDIQSSVRGYINGY